MNSFTTEIKINAPIDAVWKVLADIGNIYLWNPGVISSHLTTDGATGVGAKRHCDLDGQNYLDEEVVEWEAGRRLTLRIIGTNLPFKTADIRFTLRTANGATVVTVSPDYALRFGLLGKVFDRLYVRRNYVKGMQTLLKGLKQYVKSEH
jgi:uncharacterized protein YndB with AHSA1/START domain